MNQSMQQSPLHPDPEHSPGGGRGLTSQPPAPRRVLGWMYTWRVFLAAGLLLLVPWSTTPIRARLIAGAVVFLLALLTLTSYHRTHRRDQPVDRQMVWVQLIADACFLTLAVLLTGGDGSIFAPLYILVIGAAALLLPAVEGVAAGSVCIALYAASVAATGGTITSPLLLQLVLFGIVILVTSYLAERLRVAGAALGEVETELLQLRLDTGDILHTVNSGVITVDGAGCLGYLNPAAEELLGISAREWTGRPVLERLDEIAPGLGEVISRSARERIAIRRSETRPAHGGTAILGVSTTLVDRTSGETPAVTAIFQDITEKMRVEALRRRAERLEAVAELSASLAHEIKNPLASIRSAVEQVAGGGVDEEDAATLRALVVRESDRLSRLLGEFIDFARVKVTAPQPVDVLSLVRQVVTLVRAHPDAGDRSVQLELPSKDGPLCIRGAEDLLHRAVLNLVLNAVQWAGEGGLVTVSVDEVFSDLLSPALGAFGLVRLTVTDSGPGVPPEIAEQIFDPFFTRRPGGTGLGLALVQRAVEAHGGAIFVDNAAPGSGLGATFTLYLPSLPEEAVAEVAEPLQSSMP
ncbi:MAG TPA: ATP-binding protein [Longimicrobiaceae bacterium]|nr:ATP-binding protein [Longimicrobiaceae bacterium]